MVTRTWDWLWIPHGPFYGMHPFTVQHRPPANDNGLSFDLESWLHRWVAKRWP